MIRVKRIAHAAFLTPDLDRQIDYYTEVMGLTLVEREGDTAYLASTLDHHSVVLRKGSEAKCDRLAFQISPEDDLGDLARQIEGHGIKVERKSSPEPTIPDMITFADPKGTVMEVFAHRDPVPQPFKDKGIVPVKLGHVAFNVVDVKKVAAFYCDVLGFRVSDWMADFFVFLRCSPDHHTINLVDSSRVKVHHVAFELRDWGHIQNACDYLSTHGYPLVWGPGRHGIGHNIFCYHHNPDGHFTELFTEMDQINDEGLGYFEPRPWHRDRPQKPKVWAKDPMAANLWGITPPEGFLD